MVDRTKEILLFATRNPWKGAQFHPTFVAYGFTMLTLNDCPASRFLQAELGATPSENALAKARQFHSSNYPWVFADDAGLEIDALNGEPGLQARRWGGIFPDDVDDQTWLDYLLYRMEGIPPGQRTARFTSGWALIAPDNSEYLHTMEWPFEIALHPVRAIHPGSPISAVRIGPPDDLHRRQVEIRQEWEKWGILSELVTRSGDNA